LRPGGDNVTFRCRIGTDRVEAQVVLAAIDGMLDSGSSERLLELQASLVEMVDD
jgi:hypothetical protein